MALCASCAKKFAGRDSRPLLRGCAGSACQESQYCLIFLKCACVCMCLCVCARARACVHVCALCACVCMYVCVHVGV